MDEPAIADPSRVDADSAGSDGTLDGDAGSAGSAGSAESAESAGTAGSPESAGSADAPDTPVTAPSHGRAVVGVVVSRDPGPWFEECLASLDAQDLPGFALLVLDDGSSVDITERVAAAAPGSFVRRFESPVGYAFVRVHEGPDDTLDFGPRWGQVVTLSVLPARRGDGIGTAIMDEVDHQLAAIGIHNVEIDVMQGNERARRFYERRGYVLGQIYLFKVGSREGPR